jgi:cell division protease FtsH
VSDKHSITHEQRLTQTPVQRFPTIEAPELQAFEHLLHDNKIGSVIIKPNQSTLTYLTTDDTTGDYQWKGVLPMDLIDDMLDHGVSIKYDTPRDYGQMAKLVMEIALNVLYVLIGVLIIRSFISGGPRGNNPLNSFTSAKPPIQPEDVKIKFNDVAGLEGAKQEVMEIVDFLKNPERFTRLGAKIPRGVLLSGGPGLGKTLLAKAVAGEAGVPFFAVSASSFIELFVGTGSARVRSLFQQAKENAPCIIFIDELDAIGRARSSGAGGFGGNDEREQTINQLLTEMDGFTENNGVVVISATNRPDILDPALVRPGRFDRLIALDPPTLKDREAILGIHTKGKPLDETVDIHDLAKNTVGLSGAELANICNEASIVAARRNAEKLTMTDFATAIDRVLLGLEKKSALISEKKKLVVAAHEAGHAVVGLKVGEYDDVTKISIVPRGKSGGVTMFEQTPENAESGLYSRQYLENRLAVALGGRAAEEICFGECNVTTGAYSDMEVVQQLARAMIVNYGFSEKLGTASWANKGNTLSSEYSSTTIATIDEEVIKLTKKAYERAKNIINDNKKLFDTITQQLYEKEILNRNDIQQIVESCN